MQKYAYFLKLATFAKKLFYLFRLAVAKHHFPFFYTNSFIPSLPRFCSLCVVTDLQSAFASAQGCTASPILFFIH